MEEYTCLVVSFFLIAFIGFLFVVIVEAYRRRNNNGEERRRYQRDGRRNQGDGISYQRAADGLMNLSVRKGLVKKMYFLRLFQM